MNDEQRDTSGQWFATILGGVALGLVGVPVLALILGALLRAFGLADASGLALIVAIVLWGFAIRSAGRTAAIERTWRCPFGPWR